LVLRPAFFALPAILCSRLNFASGRQRQSISANSQQRWKAKALLDVVAIYDRPHWLAANCRRMPGGNMVRSVSRGDKADVESLPFSNKNKISDRIVLTRPVSL